MKHLKNLRSLVVVCVIPIVALIVSSNISWGKDQWKGILETDAKGYYAYLPAVFIYSDLNFGFFEIIDRGKYYDKNTYYEYRLGSNGKVISKYYCGTAVAELPFFLCAHAITYLSHGDLDGYSMWYPIFMNIAAIFYLFIGLVYVRRILSVYGIADNLQVWTLLAAGFGTNLFYYAVVEPGLSHVYSFAFIAMFIYYSKLWLQAGDIKKLPLLGLIFGMIIIIRPVNGLILLLLPFLAGSFKVLIDRCLALFEHKLILLLALIFICVLISIQLIYYKMATGRFFVYSYGNERFNFLEPHMFDILFSYKKGLFLYTPMFLLSLLGLYFVWMRSKFECIVLLCFLIVITYILSSWWSWYYGGSFSSRVYVEYLPVFMILLAIALKGIKSLAQKKLMFTVIIALILLCQLQIYAYRYYFIHWSEMTEEKYWDSYRLLAEKIFQ